MSSAEEVNQHLLELLQGEVGAGDLVVESAQVSRRGAETVVLVIVDRAEGTDSAEADQVAEISRLISDVLDREPPVAGSYVLEVSTPGAESELKRLRHYQRNLGRTIKVKLKGGDRVEGTLTQADPEYFTVETASGSENIAYDDVRKARPVIQFGRGDS